MNKLYFGDNCTAPGNLDHSLNQECGAIILSLKGVFDGPNAEDSRPIIRQVPNKKRPHPALGYLPLVELAQKTCLNWTDFGSK